MLAHGYDWKDAAGKAPALWQRLKKGFISKWCDPLGIKGLALDASADDAVTVAKPSIELPMFVFDDQVWQ